MTQILGSDFIPETLPPRVQRYRDYMRQRQMTPTAPSGPRALQWWQTSRKRGGCSLQ